MNCPVCQSAMADMEYEGAFVHTCESCGGEFVGPDALSHIVNTRDERFTEGIRTEMSEVQPQFGPSAGEPNRDLLCPACGEAMATSNYGGDSGVSVDRCGACGGIWLDHMELEKIQLLMERWADEAPDQIRAVAGKLEQTRRETAERLSGSFAGSRFAFVNALINRFLDAA